ncbi:carbohydrate-binding module family 48 [Trichoderma arundinaceum]|uniref:Carbohydrate-binding module family 48 n=1 Tax=Trichoderma arundinaceum TaxID=490622 RepID=A0A395NUU3_TRIAR|nr:carbohydrate-binding module family 48 [Trichoderma arundinaceum]
MGNNHSASNKAGGTGSPPQPPSSQGQQQSGVESPRHHHRKDGSRNIIPIHAARAAAAPESSSLQAQGSIAASVPKTKSVPTTAVSSLSGSPHSSNVSSVANAAAAVAAAVVAGSPKPSEPRPILRDEPSKPVAVPIEGSLVRPHIPAVPPYVEAQLFSNNSLTDMYMMRPPRLPLPIEEELHTPGSPILGPDESLEDLELGETSDALTRKSSALSSGTAEDEEGEELLVDKTRPVVPTKIEWRGGGEKIYVTGTIFHWNRKHRLHPVEGQPGVFAATIYILPGTHHIRFLVDGIMQTSPDLPTTVDFGNNLVNYIEVNPDYVPAAKQGETGEVAEAGKETDVSRTDSQSKEEPKVARGKPVLPLEAYNSQIPQYLLDFDQAEESPAYRNAVAAIEKLTTPPSLPGFLGKPILNAATLMKDDNSVLNMPNHTVLNHLATSSIKNNVLAVSATTRYHNKYVTTIIYKPTSADEG